MKILYVTTVAVTMDFFPEHIRMLREQGHTVEFAGSCEERVPAYLEEMGIAAHHIPFSRSPLAPGNVAAIRQLRRLVEEGKYDVVHTHTPNASACVRLACRKLRKRGLKVIYTAHGLHFYKGAPALNWLIFYPVEWLCAHWTDVLITINREDYDRAKKHLKAKKVYYVPGVGIDLGRFGGETVTRQEKRQELGIPQDARVLLSVGELNDNKNHETVIRAIAGTDVYYLIAGKGDKQQALQALIDSQGMTDRVRLLGFRRDVSQLYRAADIFVFPSYREGLSVALMEAMASGLPCAVSGIRGNTDLIDSRGGALFDPYSVDGCRQALEGLLAADLQTAGQYNTQKVQSFSQETVLEKMKEIYLAK